MAKNRNKGKGKKGKQAADKPSLAPPTPEVVSHVTPISHMKAGRGGRGTP